MHNIRAISVIGLIVALTLSAPAYGATTTATSRHPILKILTSFVLRSTVCKPKEVKADEAKMQQLFNSSDKYLAVVDRAAQVGFRPVPGQMRIVKIPVIRFVLWIIPVSYGSRPHRFVVQPMANAPATDFKALIAATKTDSVLGAAVLDSALFLKSGERGTPAYKATFLDCASEQFSKCAKPCAAKLVQCTPVLAGALTGNFAHAAAIYMVCVLANDDCGGCGVEALVDTIVEYGMSAIPAPGEQSNKQKQNN